MAFVGMKTRVQALSGAAAALTVAIAAPAAAQNATRTFDLPEQDAAQGLPAFARQAGIQIVTPAGTVRGRRTNSVRGTFPVMDALRRLLQGTGLVATEGPSGTGGLIVRAIAAAAPAQATPAQDEAIPGDIVVTAQKRSERIQDVPIAISAFTQETLDKQKIEAGPDILKAVPNLTFSKSNFAGYNLSIRGIGTKAVSVTTDPGVAINFNSSTLITNRFFEQEFFDLERIEVLRGPQGTLYGRNATGGVVNIISNKADLTKFDGYLKAEVGNFGSRRAQGAINVPIISDMLGLRLAGAYTNRDGFTTNDLTMNRIDGRNLYTTRATLSFKPTSDIRSDFIWERFSENDNRARTAKQLCHRDPGLTKADGIPTFGDELSPYQRGFTSQGCKDGSLYADSAYGVPNGLSLPYVLLGQNIIFAQLGNSQTLLTPDLDPYGETTQTKDLRRISSIFDPLYKAKANVYELNTTWGFSDRASLTMQTAYNLDRYYSTQDYNRFNTVPVFNSSDGQEVFLGPDENGSPTFGPAQPITPGGYYNDPQLGRSNRLVARDLVRARSKQFSHEIRLTTAGFGPLQGTFGVNYSYYKNQTDYFVFINALSAFAQANGIASNQSADPTLCNPLRNRRSDGLVPVLSAAGQAAGCIYIDTNSLDNINGQGHNYFRSSNRFYLHSFGIFADATYAIAPSIKLIGGLRYNDDRKVTTPVPSQLLLSTFYLLAGTVNKGYPEDPKIRQHFKAVTGRAGIQWTPQFTFTDDTMIYGTYSRGYKAGGTNPPGIGFSKEPFVPGQPPAVQLLGYPNTFQPEYVNALELGAKNSLFSKRLTFNVTGYLYDFKDYQISQIQDRQAVNENFDTTMYGLEIEGVYKLNRAITINANVGLQNAHLESGQTSLDVMDRLQGHGDEYAVIKPFVQLPANCVIRKLAIYEAGPDITTCPGSAISVVTLDYALQHPEDYPNGGRGFYAEVGGNQVPNAPHFTTNVGAEYNIPFADNWVLTPRADFYHQSGSWARIYNDKIDRLRGWENVNVSLRAGNPDIGLLIEAYVKNVFDSTPITDAFINSDDTGLTTNVFTFDPRIIGVNVTKKF